MNSIKKVRRFNISHLRALYKDNPRSAIELIKNLIANQQETQTHLWEHAIMACLYTLAREFGDKDAKELIGLIYRDNQIKHIDAENWICMPGFAGKFNSMKEAQKHGCSYYAEKISTKNNLNLAEIGTPLPTQELNTRHQRVIYAAQIALGKKSKLRVIDLGGGTGEYYVLLKRFFKDIEIDYTCIDFKEARPGNLKDIGQEFHHIEAIEPFEACDLFDASGVLPYIEDEYLETVIREMGKARVILLDRTAVTTESSFWTVQTRDDCRHPFKVFNDKVLEDIATANGSKKIIGMGLCPEDWLRVFNMEELNFEDITWFKWYLTCKVSSSENAVNFIDFVLRI